MTLSEVLTQQQCVHERKREVEFWSRFSSIKAVLSLAALNTVLKLEYKWHPELYVQLVTKKGFWGKKLTCLVQLYMAEISVHFVGSLGVNNYQLYLLDTVLNNLHVSCCV